MGLLTGTGAREATTLRRRVLTRLLLSGGLAGAALTGLGAVAAGAAVRTASASTDTYVTATSPGSSFRTTSYLKVSGKSGHRKVSYLRFHVAGMADGSVVSAKLTLSRRTSDRLWGMIQAHIVPLGSFNIRKATWRNRPTLGPVISSGHVSRTTKTITLDVTTATTDGIYGSGWVTIALTGTSRYDSQFSSQNATRGRPVLTVTNAPTTIAQRPICPVSDQLVPACGRYWGAAPASGDLTTAQRVSAFETEAGRPLDIVHRYATNGTLFPTADDIVVSTQAGQNRLLFYTWRPATDKTWAQVAAGSVDARIDAEATYLKAVYGARFYLAIAPKPESQVNPKKGSGMTAADYVAMYRHVVGRLRQDGVGNAVYVLDYSTTAKYGTKAWFPGLWPGDDVVDWIGYSAFDSSSRTGTKAGSLAHLVNGASAKWPGFYSWATTVHPGKPLMLAEWGIHGSPANPAGKAAYFTSIAAQIGAFPLIRAFVYEEFGDHSTGTRPDTDAASLATFAALGVNPAFIGPTVTLR